MFLSRCREACEPGGGQVQLLRFDDTRRANQSESLIDVVIGDVKDDLLVGKLNLLICSG